MNCQRRVWKLNPFFGLVKALDCILIISENGERFSGGFNINVFQQVHKTGTQAALLVLTKTTQFISSSPCFGLVPSLPSLTSINCQRRRQDKTAQPRVIPLQADGIQRYCLWPLHSQHNDELLMPPPETRFSIFRFEQDLETRLHPQHDHVFNSGRVSKAESPKPWL